MADPTYVLDIKVSFSMVVVDSLIIDTSVNELNGESLLRDTLRCLEERQILGASRLIQETSKSDLASRCGIRRVVDVVYLFETSGRDQCGAASIDGIISGTIGPVELARHKFPGNKFLHPVIHFGYWSLRDCFSKVGSRSDKIDVSLETVRNGVSCRPQLLNAGILIIVECGTEKTIRRVDCGGEIYICAITVCVRNTGLFKPCQDSGTRIR